LVPSRRRGRPSSAEASRASANQGSAHTVERSRSPPAQVVIISSVNISYDQRAGVVYLRLSDDNEDIGTVSSRPVALPEAEGADDYIVLDFDDAGRLVGIEFLTPEQRLLPSVLAEAQSARP
jgi:uncharacterized protein YuzE